MQLSERVWALICVACLTPGLLACGAPAESAAGDGRLPRRAWLGSADGWGLLGFPLRGGPITYRRAENLEPPTWAPPELGGLAGVWPGKGAVWVRFDDGRLGRYDYATGHLLSFDGYDPADRAVALQDGSGLIIAPGGKRLERVAEADGWRFTLDGSLTGLEAAGDGEVLALVEKGDGAELLVLEPPRTEPVGRRTTARIRDLAITAWGRTLYYLTVDPGDSLVHALTLPTLEEATGLPLDEPGWAVAVTPSAHRIYVAAGRALQVFDRVRARRIREVPLPAAATALRFSENGAHLLARLAGPGEVAVLQVGVDSVLGVVPAEWGEQLPVVVPGGRLIVAVGGELILYDLPRLVEIARAEGDGRRVWLAVNWQPPRPRVELARRTVGRREAEEAEVTERAAGPGEPSGAGDPSMGASAPPGVYAVVAAARQSSGVEDLVTWLRGVGYPARMDRYEDVMGALWFRAMVGPYAVRDSAEATARSLNARYGYKPWILTIDAPAGAPSDSGDSGQDVEEGADGSGV